MKQNIGTQLLYCSYKDNERVIASHVKQLFNKDVPIELNQAVISAFLMYQYSVGGNTLFKDIRTSQWTQPVRVIQLDGPPLTGQLRGLICRSILSKTAGSQRISLLLSGGIDSSVIGALVTWVRGDRIRDAFTATFNNHSELDKATSITKLLGLRLHDVCITADMVARNIENITAIYEEPLGDAGLVNNYFLCRAASSVSDTVLCGDGGDEIFGGYPWHRFAKYIPLMNKTPLWLRKFMQGFVTGDPTTSRNKLERILLFPLQLSTNEMILYPTTAMSYQNVKWLLKLSICDYGIVSSDYKDIYNRMLAMDCLNLLPGKFGMKANKFSPPTIRSPFIDKDIISFAFGLPTRLRKDKYILRKAVEGILPHETVWRKKAGFGTPIADWLNSKELKPMVLDRLENGKLLNEICKKQSLDKIVEVLKSSRIGGGTAAFGLANIIWGLFTLQVWYDVWFEK